MKHNDEPTLDDLIGRKDLVQEVGEEIAACEPPQVFGIHGDWGAGKTSFLHQLHWYLTGECPELASWTDEYKSPTELWGDGWLLKKDKATSSSLFRRVALVGPTASHQSA